MKTFDPECNNRKRCRWCGFLKPLEEFYTSRITEDGFRSRCKVCMKLAQREKERERKKKERERKKKERERKKKHTIKGKMQAEIDCLKKQNEILRECVESLGWHANAKDALTKLEAMEKEGWS